MTDTPAPILTWPPALPLAATQNIELLRLLAVPGHGLVRPASVAAALGRDPANTRRALHTLSRDGIIDADTLTLTDTGHRILRGLSIADGSDDGIIPAAAATTPATPTRWPIAAIRPNPANRTIDPVDLDDLVASISTDGMGDILQPLILTPPDDAGIRMILAGERRWRAACRLSDALQLPDALAEGLPFVERDATPVEALLITVVENSQRQDLSPLDDARQLLKLADASGWSGAELARRIGRADTEHRNGVKDVQDKLKIARTATPDAIAEYNRTGSWDALRNSVRTSRAAPDAAADDAAPPDADAYRREDPARPNVSDLIRPGMLLRTNYGTGPYYVVTVTRQDHPDGVTAWCLAMRSPRNGRDPKSGLPDAWINDVVVEWEGDTPHFRQMFRDNADEVLLIDDPAGTTTSPDPLVVNGTRYPNLTRANEARRDAGTLPRASVSAPSHRPRVQTDAATNPGAGADADDTPALFPDEAADHAGDHVSVLSRKGLILLELAHKTADDRAILPNSPRWTGDPLTDLPGHACRVGSYWLDADWPDLVRLDLAQVVHTPGDTPPLARLTPRGAHWLMDRLVPPGTPADLIAAVRTATGLNPAPGATYAIDWIETIAAPADTSPWPIIGTPPADNTSDDSEPATTAHDAATLRRIDDLITGTATPDRVLVRDLLHRCGYDGPFGADGCGNVMATPADALQPAVMATVDVPRDLPTARAHGLALIIAWALNRACNAPADGPNGADDQ